MKIRNGIWFIILFSLLGVIIVSVYNPGWEKRCIKTLAKEKSSSLYGVVTGKYYVKGNMYPTIEVSDQNSKVTKKSFHAEKSGLFDYLEVGDTISKGLNTLNYNVIRGDSIRIYKFTMFCNEEKSITMPNNE